MSYRYKQTFDAVQMTPECQKSIRAKLSSHFTKEQKENSDMDIRAHSIKRMRFAVIAAVMLSFLLLVGFTFGSQIIQLLGGTRVETGRDSRGYDYVTLEMGTTLDLVENRDGVVYLILDGSNTDITKYCTESTYYEFEQIAGNGYRHVVVVGGTPDNLGWSEYIWDAKGEFIASNAEFPTVNDGGEKPYWLQLADEALRN